MIHIFGDSWTYSYKAKLGSDEFDGPTLAEQLGNILKTSIIHHGERGYSNFRILNKIQDSLEEIKKGDIILVLQTDPLRSIFVPWNRWPTYLDNYNLIVDSPKNLIEISDQILFDYYQKLKELQDQTETTVILHGGCSKLNYNFSQQFNLIYTERSSSEIIANSIGDDFSDCYFFDIAYVVKVRDFLIKNKSCYRDDSTVMMDLLIQCQRKHTFWHGHSKYFAGFHPSPIGTALVAEYLADFLQQNHLI